MFLYNQQFSGFLTDIFIFPAQIKSVLDLKKVNPDLKIMIAVGGWNAGIARFQKMSSTAANRKKFIDSSLAFMENHNLDGFDLDWEYPTATDKDNFSILLKVKVDL